MHLLYPIEVVVILVKDCQRYNLGSLVDLKLWGPNGPQNARQLVEAALQLVAIGCDQLTLKGKMVYRGNRVDFCLEIKFDLVSNTLRIIPQLEDVRIHAAILDNLQRSLGIPIDYHNGHRALIMSIERYGVARR